ncbi:hypothetical protein AYK24_07395 [Thermoplasmatales archaeon SG8-52-4]|nr:MAG: hypothetical protein AYK24_07395 [Thermoplasmatales archaeon SG8-52-4]
MVICASIQSNGQSPGIECGCDNYGDYVAPASEAIYIQQSYNVQVASSKNGKYRVEVSDAQYPNIVNLRVFYGNIELLNMNSRAYGWGFSPDEDRFAMHGFDTNNKHWYTLYNLNPDHTVDGEQAIEVVPSTPTDVSSARLRFSPHGKYLLYGAIGNMGNLVLYIHNAISGDVVYHPTALIVGSPSGESVAGWGFSSDVRDRTFVHAMLSDANTYTLSVKNLEKPADEYVLLAPGNDGGANFRFSPCGDYFLWTWEDAVNEPTCYFYKTGEKNASHIDGSGIGMKKAYTEADGHYIKYFNGNVKIFDNMSDIPCDDDEPPVWTGTTMTTSNISGTSLDLSWDAATDPSGSIYYKILQDGSPVKEIETLTQVRITDLTPETTYNFEVEAGDEAGNWNTEGPSVDVTTLSDNPPEWTNGSLIASEVEGVKMTLTWSGVSDDHNPELSYRIYADGTVIEEIYGTNTCLITGLDPVTSYNFKVEAGDEADQWTMDGPQLIQATSSDNQPTWPPNSEILLDSITETSLAFQWPEADDDWGVIKYQIYRDGDLIRSLSAYERNILDEDLEGGTVYLYEIKAGDEAGNWSAVLSKDLKTMSPFVELPLITETGTQSLPDIFDQTIVWQDTRNGNADIFSHDLETEIETALITDGEWQGKPVISGKRIVWADARNGNSDIYMHDPWHGTVVICDEPGEQTIPQIDGMKIVWADFRTGDWDIYMYDLETLQEKAICTASGRQTAPSVSGNIIVWEDHRNGNPDIYGYKLYYDEEFIVCDDPADQTNPVVDVYSNYRILWQDNRYGNWDIYMWTPFLNTTFIQRVNLGYSGNQTNPHIADDQLVYQEDKDGSLDIYAYKFYNKYYGNVEPICTADGDQVNPRTSKGRIVWEDRRNDEGDIYIWDRPPGTDLSLEITEVTDPIGVGKILKYILKATNDGPDDEVLAKVICELPLEAELSDTSITQGTVARNGLELTWDVGALSNDSSALLEINLETYTITKLYFTAQISGTGFDPDPSNNRINETTFVKEVVGETIGEGYEPSMFVEPDGIVHVFFAEDDSTVYTYKNVSGSWHYTYLDSIFEIQSSDILLDNNGHIHICYSDQNWEAYPDGWLYYSTNEENGIWKNRIIALSDSSFSSIAMDINDQDNIHMLYQQSPGAAFGRPFKYMNYKSGQWSQPVVFAKEGYDHIDMVLDRDGFAHVSYFEINKGVIYRKSADTEIRSWSASEIIEPDWGGGQLEGMINDIGLDSLKNPHIVYPGNTDNDHKENIKYARKMNGIWSYEQIDEGDFASGANAIVVEPSGIVHLAYIHFPSGEVRYATNVAGPWIKQTIDDDFEGWLNVVDMGLDASGNVHLLYESGIIKYAKRPPIQHFTVNPDTLDFGIVKLDSSKTNYLKLFNPGFERIAIDSISILESADFSVGDIDMILYPDMEDSIEVEFSPKSKMKVATNLRIFFNGASQMFMDVPIIAATPAPVLTVSPDTVNFGYVNLGSEEIKTVTLTNTGQEDLVIFEINVKYEMYGNVYPTDFDLGGHDCTVLNPGESCSAQVSLTPTKAGMHTSFLNIYSNDLESDHKKVILSGYTSMAQISAEFSQMDFGYQDIDQTVTETMKIYNTGQLDLTISNTTISGSNVDAFDFRNACTTIVPGDSCEMEVDFIPVTNGDFTATLNLFSNSQYSNPLKVNLYGNSSLRELEVTPTSIDFGQNALSAQDKMTQVTLINNGSNDLIISETTITGADLYEFSNSGCSGTLTPGESCQDTIWFSPLFTGSKHAILRVSSNDSDEPVLDIPLAGIAIEFEEDLYNLSGQIFDEDGIFDVTKGTLDLYISMDPNSKQQLLLDGVNDYNFTDLVDAEYTVKFTPDPVLYPDGLPTYLGNVLTLAEASFVLVNTDITDQNIRIIAKPEDGTGDGKINGNLQEDEGNQRATVTIGASAKISDVLEDAFVYLINSNTNELVSYDVTDPAGYFEFINLENGSYIFIVDYNGIPMDIENPLLSINQTNDSINIVSTVFTDKIDIQILVTTGIWDTGYLKDIVIYPNPTGGEIFIKVSEWLRKQGMNRICLHDIQGNLLIESAVPNLWETEARIDIEQIPDGIYILTVTGQEESYSAQLIIKK